MADIFIDVRNTRAYVSRKRGTDSNWTHEPCANWESLEDMAAKAVSEAGGHTTMSGIYPCPEQMAKLALWPEDVLELVGTVTEVERAYGVSKSTITRALVAGKVRGKQIEKNWVIYLPDAEKEWTTR
jgi:hypothetical protein